VGTFLQDLRYGFRTLRKLPGYTVIAILTLALGIGANTAIFSIVYSVILAPLPYPHPEQLVMVWSKLNGERNRVSPGDFLDWQRESSAFQSLSAWTGGSFDLSGGGAIAQEVDGELMSPDFLRTSGGAVHLGRTFRPDESEAGKNHVVILANKFWQSRFGSDPSIVGKQIRLDREPYTVVGVLAPGEMDRTSVSVLMPLTFTPEQINHKEHWLWVVARMRPGVTAAQAEADMRVVAQHIAAAHPDDEKNRTVSVEPLHDDWLPAATITEL
jgi:putative ABC transport system permease protein